MADADTISQNVIGDVIAERVRQMRVKGYTYEHDDEHMNREIARGAATHVLHYVHRAVFAAASLAEYRMLAGAPKDCGWPDDWNDFEPSTPRADLVRAAAMIIAEIERLDRKEAT